MKIPSLLAQYLYSNQRLDLPGIGTFLLDNSAISALQHSKQRAAVLEGVSFQSNPSLKESSELVAYIAEKTGKMKALAASDLESHLVLAQQFLNMGKPFSFEGIGILTRIKPGEFEFTPITVATEKIRDQQKTTAPDQSQKEEAGDSFLAKPRTPFEWRKPVIGLFIICGLGFAIWGGYKISARNKSASSTPSENTQLLATAVDTIQKSDSLPPAPPPAPDTYKYVLEIAKSKRAFKRFNQLKEIRWKVQLETRDSIQYKIFMLLPAISDTTRTLDSLTAMTGRKVHIDYSN